MGTPTHRFGGTCSPLRCSRAPVSPSLCLPPPAARSLGRGPGEPSPAASAATQTRRGGRRAHRLPRVRHRPAGGVHPGSRRHDRRLGPAVLGCRRRPGPAGRRLRQRGRREVRAAPGELTIRRMGNTTAKLIRKLRLGRADVVAWSMGGMIAQSLVIRHPRLVRRMVLMATAPGDGNGVPPDGARVRGAAGECDRQLGLLFTTTGRRPPTSGTSACAPIRISRSRPRSARRSSSRQATGSTATTGPPCCCGGSAIRSWSAAAVATRSSRTATSASSPAAITHIRLVKYQRGAHGFYLQYRRDFLRRIDDFLR